MCRKYIPSIIEGLISSRDRLYRFKDNLSSIFRDMGSFMFSTSNQLESFMRIMAPYVRYFYPAEITSDGECFINEVVNPCRIEMNSAINMAVRIMEGDDRINDTVSNAIERVLEIQSDVDRILSVIEAIEIYAVNTTLVATKAGSEGFPLTKISQEMSKLSERANWVSTGCRTLIDELDDAFDRFSMLRESIGILNENYLTRMQVQSNLVFNELIEDLNALSVDANDILGFANDIEGSIGQVMKWLQIEDIVRQDLEKVIYLIEGIDNGDADGNLLSSITNHDDRERVIDLVALLAKSKMLSIGENVKPLTDGTIGCCDRIKGILSDFLGGVYRKDGTDEDSPDGDRFNRIYRKLEEMKNEFIRLIKEIIDGKRNLYGLSMKIFDMVNSFESFFADLSGIAKHFETINILTRIELAKHVSLSRTLGVALTDVRDLPSRMKAIIGNSAVLYREVSKNIRASIEDYHQSYKRQEENLLSCIESMERISVKLSESQQYYKDISKEIGEVSSSILEYMESGAERLAGMIDFEDIINNSITMLKGDDDAISCEHIETLRHYLNGSAGDSYRSTVLNSFLSEAQRPRGNSVLLF
jgi:hypothetical protein